MATTRSAAALLAATLPLSVLAQSDPLAEPFSASLELADLNGDTGFRLAGIDAGDISGYSVSSAGDVNGDGIDDLIIGAFPADPYSRYEAGETYVVFGRDAAVGGFPAAIELKDLDGTNGFRLVGIAREDRSGSSVASAGDVNGDSVDDLIIAAFGADPGGRDEAGQTYVVFGRNAAAGGFPAAVELVDLDGTSGFRINGIDANDRSGISVNSAGDVNGDGVDDLIIGAPNADPDGRDFAGETYVVFGRNAASGGFPQAVELADLDGTNGFRLNGINAYDVSGESVASAGDVNGDGVDDIVIGASNADPEGRLFAGETYVVFGRDAALGSFPAVLELASLDGTDGFRLDGIDPYDVSGRSVASAGDINGDGVDDLVIGARGADPSGRDRAGETYVVLGRDGVSGGFPAVIELADLDGTDGFRIEGVDANDSSGEFVASAGDINGDGVGDLIIGAPTADQDGQPFAGEAYVVFGRDAGAGSFPVTIELADLDGTNGFRLNGIDADDNAGFSVASAGDINGDGVSDVVFGAPFADSSGRPLAGESYVVFGRSFAGCPADLDGDGDLTIFDFLAFQNLFDAGDPIADFDGDGRLTLFDFLAFQNAFDAGCP
ncbi:MAG: integrin alpha [Planctomycetota bacterium]